MKKIIFAMLVLIMGFWNCSEQNAEDFPSALVSFTPYKGNSVFSLT